MLRVVLDTNVLVSGLRSRNGASFRVLQAIGRKLKPQVSVPLVLEYEDVLLRKGVVPGLAPAQAAVVLDYLCQAAEQHAIFFLWRPLLRDTKDDMVLELAVTSGALWIVTHNLRDFAGGERFGVAAITPQQCLKKLENV